MHPVLADLEFLGRHFEVKAYSTFLIAAAVVVIAITLLTAHRRGISLNRVLICMIVAGAAAFVGARFLHAMINPELYRDSPGRLVSFARTGFSLYGGILAAALTIVVGSRVLRIDLWKLADSIALALGPGIILARIGCFLNGCCAGESTNMPWGIVFPTAADVNARAVVNFFGLSAPAPVPQPVHPTQIYEIIAAMVGIMIVLAIIRYQRIDGLAFFGFSVWFTLFRWFNWQIREIPESFTAPTWFYPAFYCCLISIILIAAFIRIKLSASLKPPTIQEQAVSPGYEDIFKAI